MLRLVWSKSQLCDILPELLINQFPFGENWLIAVLPPIDFALAVPSIDFALGSSQGSKSKKLYFWLGSVGRSGALPVSHTAAPLPQC